MVLSYMRPGGALSLILAVLLVAAIIGWGGDSNAAGDPPEGAQTPSTAAGRGAGIGPRLRFLQCLRETGLTTANAAANAAASAIRAQVSLRFRHPPSPGTIADLEREGVEFFRHGGELLHTATVYPAWVEWDRLSELARRGELRRVESVWRPHPQPPLDVSRAEIQADGAWELFDGLGRPVTGEGILIADFDTGIDLYHPMFWMADGDTLAWIDANGNDLFDPGTDGVDLDGDSFLDPGELLSYYEGAVYGDLPHDSLNFNPDLDWLFNDADGNGERDYGSDQGFTENDPTYGELIFWTLDANENDSLDVGERLLALNTCKVRAIYETAGTVRRRGVDLIQAEGDYYPHGTMVAGILAGGVPKISRLAGIAPGAELLMGNNVYIEDPPFIVSLEVLIPWAAAEGADIMLYEDGEWVWTFLDGSSNVETMINEEAGEGIVQVVPAGNLADGRMHIADTVAAGDPALLVLSSPTSTQLFEMWPSILWRGAADTALAITLEAPTGDSLLLDGDADYDLLGPYSVYSCLSVSSRGTVKLDVHIRNALEEGPVDGLWSFHLTNRELVPVAVHGFTWDNVSSWQGFSFWIGHEGHTASTVTWPATADSAISVGAYRVRYDEPDIFDFSGRGPRIDGVHKVDLAAPGNVFTTVPGNGDVVPGGFASFYGTSAAGPHVAGAAALLLQLKPEVSHGEVREILRAAALADSFTGAVPNHAWGWGKLRVFDALAPHTAAEETPGAEAPGHVGHSLWLQVNPNPTAGGLALEYALPRAGPVEIGLYDVMGRLIARLDQGERGAGSRTLRWDGRLANGGIVSPGIYFVRVSSDELEVTRKVVLCR